MSDLHPPKREIFDVPAMINTDNKGFVRPVERYEEASFGLYMSRTADHPRFSHLESWLLPTLGLRANIFHFVEGHRTGQRLYLDIGRFQGPDRRPLARRGLVSRSGRRPRSPTGTHRRRRTVRGTRSRPVVDRRM